MLSGKHGFPYEKATLFVNLLKAFLLFCQKVLKKIV